MTPWLTAHTTVQLAEGWPAAYELLVDHVVEALAEDETWQTWWRASGVPECRLLLTLAEISAGSMVQAGGTRVEVQHSAYPEPLDSRDPAELQARAAADVTTMLEAARRELALDPLPAMTLPDPPDDLPRGTRHPGDQSPFPATEPHPGGLLRDLVSGLFGRLRR